MRNRSTLTLNGLEKKTKLKLFADNYLTNKGPSSQSYGFSNSHVWMWELDYKESWTFWEPPKIKSVTVSSVFPSITHEVMGPNAIIFVFWMLSYLFYFIFKLYIIVCWVLSQRFHSPLSLSSRGSLVIFFLPHGWHHLHIWDYWYFSWQSWFQLVLIPAHRFSWCTLHIS